MTSDERLKDRFRKGMISCVFFCGGEHWPSTDRMKKYQKLALLKVSELHTSFLVGCTQRACCLKQGNESVLCQKSYVEEASRSILVMFAG